MTETPSEDRGAANPEPGSLDAELARADAPPRWLRAPVVRGGSLRIGVLGGFVASFIPTALFFGGGGTRTANLVGIALLLIAGMVAVPPMRRRTGVGAIAGLLVGAVMAGIVAFFTSWHDGFTHGFVF